MRRVSAVGLMVLVVALASSPALVGQPAASQCEDWRECRSLALEARDAADFERFHDLAWRAWQTRGAKDPELMFLLARSQSLSGRPLDALVMLNRLAELGETFDALTHEDLARARALAAWPETAAALERAAAADGATAAATENASAPASDWAPAAREGASGLAAKPHVSGVAAGALPASSDVARFAVPTFAPGGLAYDGVSRRFIIGNLPARKLTVVGEGTNRPVTYAGAAAAFYDVRALQIDRGQGDLWVVSTDCETAQPCRSALHKLQLISGRVLKVFDTPQESSRLMDVAVTRAGAIVLDGDGPRLLTPDAAQGTMKSRLTLPEGEAISLAASPDGGTVYVAYRDRLVRVNLQNRQSVTIEGNGPRLEGISRIRWHRGALVAIRTGAAEDKAEIVRIRLGRGGARVSAVQTLSELTNGAGALLAMDIAGDDLYYLLSPASPESDAVVRSMSLR